MNNSDVFGLVSLALIISVMLILYNFSRLERAFLWLGQLRWRIAFWRTFGCFPVVDRRLHNVQLRDVVDDRVLIPRAIALKEAHDQETDLLNIANSTAGSFDRSEKEHGRLKRAIRKAEKSFWDAANVAKQNGFHTFTSYQDYLTLHQHPER